MSCTQLSTFRKGHYSAITRPPEKKKKDTDGLICHKQLMNIMPQE